MHWWDRSNSTAFGVNSRERWWRECRTRGMVAIRGEHGFDIRDFGISSPTVLMFRIYPDVMVKLQLEAELHD